MQTVYRETQRFITVKRHYLLDAAPHIHERIELIYVKSGKGFARCDGRETPLNSDTYFLVFPNQVHSYTGYDGCDGNDFYKVIINPNHLFSFGSSFLNFIPETPIYIPEDDSIFSLLKLLFERVEANSPEDVIRGLLTALFGELLQHYKLIKRTAPSDKTVEVLNYCQEHFTEPISVETLCRELFISRSYISYIFNKRLGISYSDYINSLRLNKALNLIKNSDYSVSRAAFEAGFSGLRNFNHAFKKKYGVTPTMYLKG